VRCQPIEKNPSSNTTQQPQTPANGIYEVTIAPDTLQLNRGGKTCQIRSGMDGRADIISKEETILQFILRKARLWDLYSSFDREFYDILRKILNLPIGSMANIDPMFIVPIEEAR
jgi:hypothetical protein